MLVISKSDWLNYVRDTEQDLRYYREKMEECLTMMKLEPGMDKAAYDLIDEARKYIEVLVDFRRSKRGMKIIWEEDSLSSAVVEEVNPQV